MRWTDAQASQYYALSRIDRAVWHQIFTAVRENRTSTMSRAVKEDFTEVKIDFTERFLRDIVDLLPSQQHELVDGLLNGKIGLKARSS
jgi:hypothetical protein